MMIDKDTISTGERIQAAASTKANQNLLKLPPDRLARCRGGVFKNYSRLPPGKKGKFGEGVVSDVCTGFGLTVTKPLGRGHDRCINGIRTEIKTSMAQIDGTWMINHVGVKKDWERIIILLIGPNLDDDRLVWFTKEAFLEMNKTKKYFTRQQGGKRGKNDDRMSTGKKLENLINSGLATELSSEW